MIYIIISIVLVTLLFLWLYYKNRNTHQYKVSVSNGILAFSTAKDYIKIVSEPNEQKRERFLTFLKSKIEFNSLAKNSQTDLHEQLNDGFIELLLNKDGYLQVGNYIYKINPFAETTLVIPAKNFSESLLKEISEGVNTNPLITTYQIDDDVIGMVESNTPPSQRGLFCGESGCGSDRSDKTVPLTNPQDHSACNDMYCEVKYFRAGIYFSLLARCNNRCPSRRMYWHKDPVQFKVKCGRRSGPDSQWDIDSGGNGSNSSWVIRFYAGVQPLNGFWLRIVFMAKDASWIGNPDNPSADLVIRKNM